MVVGEYRVEEGGGGGEGAWAAPGGTPGAPVIVRLVPA